jgi:hypothetical protein
VHERTRSVRVSDQRGRRAGRAGQEDQLRLRLERHPNIEKIGQFERLDENRRRSLVQVGAFERPHQRRFQAQLNGPEVGRVFRLRIDTGGPVQFRAQLPAQGQNFIKGEFWNSPSYNVLCCRLSGRRSFGRNVLISASVKSSVNHPVT